MKQEDREILIKDLCARLPYNFVYCYCNAPLAKGKPIILTPVVISNLMNATDDLVIKPYLRSMSSMTEEEKEELKQEHFKDERLFAECLTKMKNGDSSMRGKVIPHFASDWCNKNHFDYRGLIEKGLALEAPKDMYNI